MDDDYAVRLARFVAEELARRADSSKAPAMAAYMKTEMAFYGVHKPDRAEILRRVMSELPPADVHQYRSGVESLWNGSHREEKYLAIGYARSFPDHIGSPQLDLFRRMIVEGAWWDFVDEIAAHLIGRVLQKEPGPMRDVLGAWIDADDMWLRRAALLSQLRLKEETDPELLFEFCRRRAHDKELFIRKAIGWALRDYSRTYPEAVARFLDEEGDRLSPLSRTEASRHL